MGYITSFKVKLYHKDTLKEVRDEDTLVLIEHKLQKQSNYHFDNFYAEGKWYEFDRDMKEVSKKYPEIYFMLEGDGEESGDIWTNVYLNGNIITNWSAEYTRPSINELI